MTASASFSSAIGITGVTLSVRARAETINRGNDGAGPGGKTGTPRIGHMVAHRAAASQSSLTARTHRTMLLWYQGCMGIITEPGDGSPAARQSYQSGGLILLETIYDLQRTLYSQSVEALQALHTVGLSGLPALIGVSFGFGMLHALLPGHGKSVLASYYAGDGRLLGALGSSTVLIVTHVGSAVLLVLTGFVVLQRTIGGAGRAPTLEHASQVLVLLIGCYLLWRAFRPHSHAEERSGPALGFVTGLVPCPLTTFIMTYAVAHGLIVSGLILAATFAMGMIVTVAAFPLLAVLLRTWLLPMMARSEGWRSRLAHLLEVGAAVMVMLLGLWPLMTR